MKHLDLFSGIGGFALAARWAGINTVAFCEIEPFCQQVLKKNFPGIPIYQDIRTLNFDGTVDIITGGYPCQPFSVAGKQKASADDRHLWPEMYRVIGILRPRWVVCENVHGHIRLGLDEVLSDLESLDYAPVTLDISSLGNGRSHNRRRIFIVAHSLGIGQNPRAIRGGNDSANDRTKKGEDQDFNPQRCRRLRTRLDWRGHPIRERRAKPPALRVDDGLPNRLDRVAAIGNAIDPLHAYQIFQSILKAEEK